MNIYLIRHTFLKLLDGKLRPCNDSAYLKIVFKSFRTIALAALSQINSILFVKPDLWKEVFATSKCFLNATQDGFKFMIRSAVDFQAADLLHEREVASAILNLIKNSKVFVDIGANIGCYTVRAPSLMKNLCVVLAFEPHPLSFALLKTNLRLNYSPVSHRIKLFNLALGSFDGYTKLYAPPESLAQASTNLKFIEKTRTFSNYDVYYPKCCRLDSVKVLRELDCIDFIKIDVEGAELDVLKGASQTLRKVENIVIETDHENAVCTLLSKFGFKLRKRFHSGFYLYFSKN